MPAVRTITRAVNNAVSVQIPEEYSAYSLEVIVLPILDDDCNRELHGLIPPRNRQAVFGALKNKIKYIAPDFDEPLDDFAEYM